MNTSKRLCLSLVVLIAVGMLLAWPATALGDGPVTGTQLTLGTPVSVNFGDHVNLVAGVFDSSGKPVPKATVDFYSPVSFLAGSGSLEMIGEATSDARGVAAIDYVPTITESMHIVAKFAGDAQHSPSQVEITVPVIGDHQLYQAEAGIKVPFIGKWILVGVLSFVWGTYFLVVNLILRIASTTD